MIEPNPSSDGTAQESSANATTLESELVCPICGFAKRETMPVDSCQFFYQCSNCHTVLRPKPGDCCVFCSYGSVKCPSVQADKSGDHPQLE